MRTTFRHSSHKTMILAAGLLGKVEPTPMLRGKPQTARPHRRGTCLHCRGGDELPGPALLILLEIKRGQWEKSCPRIAHGCHLGCNPAQNTGGQAAVRV